MDVSADPNGFPPALREAAISRAEHVAELTVRYLEGVIAEDPSATCLRTQLPADILLAIGTALQLGEWERLRLSVQNVLPITSSQFLSCVFGAMCGDADRGLISWAASRVFAAGMTQLAWGSLAAFGTDIELAASEDDDDAFAEAIAEFLLNNRNTIT